MSSLVESAKSTLASTTSTSKTDKIVDLERDIQTPSRNAGDLTTDHGVKVPDTDNWCVVFKLVSACWLTHFRCE